MCSVLIIDEIGNFEFIYLSLLRTPNKINKNRLLCIYLMSTVISKSIVFKQFLRST